MRTEVLDVSGMRSEDCTETVMRAIQNIDGVKNVSVSYPESRAIVQFDEERTAAPEMGAALSKAGYSVRKVNLDGDGEGCGGCCGGGCGGKAA